MSASPSTPDADPAAAQLASTQLRFALAVLGIIAILCITAGALLLWAGYQSGELFVGIAGSAGTIGGMLSMRNHGTAVAERSEAGGQRSAGASAPAPTDPAAPPPSSPT